MMASLSILLDQICLPTMAILAFTMMPSLTNVKVFPVFVSFLIVYFVWPDLPSHNGNPGIHSLLDRGDNPLWPQDGLEECSCWQSAGRH